MPNPSQNDLFSSLIFEIKSYSGKDPILPWLKGIRTMKDRLPAQLLNEKLPRFLQKCAQTFQFDRVYRNDLRYVRVWLQLMDFVDDPKALLKAMEMNGIGTKRSLFYQAYALYYEKMKKFEDAEKMYRSGVQNLAEPLDELQRSYEQFLHRMERHKTKKVQRQVRKSCSGPLSTTRSIPLNCTDNKENNFGSGRADCQLSLTRPMEVNPSTEIGEHNKNGSTFTRQESIVAHKSDHPKMFLGDDKLVIKLADTAIVDSSETENACHHGLVEPTINMKEAMDEINNMFREPIASSQISRRRSYKSRLKDDQSLVFVDDSLRDRVEPSHKKENKMLSESSKSFEIYVDGEENEEDENEDGDEEEHQVFVFPNPNDYSAESSNDRDVQKSPRPKFRGEDTVVGRFVGSTIMDDDEAGVENACHHGLVDPTINLKEAMADINNMFGKPMEFVRTNRRKNQEKAPNKRTGHSGFSILSDDENVNLYQKDDSCGFSILSDDNMKSYKKKESSSFSIRPDDDIEPQKGNLKPKSSTKARERDLFEPTMCTKEARDEINKMFGMPMDF